MKSILLTAWLAMNIFTFSLYGADKRKARRGAWRISEKTLLTCTWRGRIVRDDDVRRINREPI